MLVATPSLSRATSLKFESPRKASRQGGQFEATPLAAYTRQRTQEQQQRSQQLRNYCKPVAALPASVAAAAMSPATLWTIGALLGGEQHAFVI